MAHEIHVTKDFGHPWTGEKGWDLLEAKADTEEELDRLIQAAESKYWNVWLRDNTGNIGVAMYKPTGATRKWECRPSNNGNKAEIIWK